MGGEISQIDCCLGTETDDHRSKAKIELSVMKKTLDSQKKANRKFRLQKESEIRKYRKRICALEGERQSLICVLKEIEIREIQNLSGISQSVMTEDMNEADGIMNEVQTSSRETRESSLDSVAGTSSFDSPVSPLSFASDCLDSIIHVNDDKYGVA